MNSQQQRLIAALQTFLNTPLDAQLQRAASTNSQATALELFRAIATTVPAYQDFLKKQGIEPETIKTFSDFQSLPLTTKSNYLQAYPLAALCRHGKLETCDFIAVSSGSTGKPTYWPRFVSDEFSIATRFEQVFCNFGANTKSTLAVVCFPLGTWVGGMYTTSCCRHLAAKGYPITLITPGNNKTEIFRVVQELATLFEQTVLLGYPPFLKDAIDSGISQGIEWSRYSIKLVFAGEVFSEEWRTLVGERVGSSNFCYDSASLYGTADAGVLGNETPLSICIRRFLANHPDIARNLFGESRLPTLVQYDPNSRFFETQEDGTLLFSGDNGIPLMRYHISDTGGIISYEEMLQFLKERSFDPLKALESSQNRGISPLPFVYVFGRSHFTVSYFGANIYPENVMVGLEQLEIREWVTGKFVMEVKEDDRNNRFLSIVVELASGVIASPQIEHAIACSIHTQLLRLNSEFANYVPLEYQSPQITLTALGDPEYFPLGVKHRYTRNDAKFCGKKDEWLLT
ncbi:phenylacetate--CoA ligase family protein [Candidatus Gracilibacteria bacterium]|nr:phenylacetate--CoA ligase family protein [Candidatus Gracilibacteria bacterium]